MADQARVGVVDGDGYTVPDGELQMTRSYPLHLEIFRSVTGQLQHLSCQVLEDSSAVDRGGGSNSTLARRLRLHVPEGWGR